MKVLFAVSNENISESIIKKYQSMYKEIISGKNVYYFNAILKELQKDKTYDRIVISEDLEPLTNKNYETIDNFIFEKLDRISDEAVNSEGEDVPVILIATDRRTKGENMLSKLFGIGVYSTLIGQDRSIDEVCKLINKPRPKKEAKIYYKIDSNDIEYRAENEDNVSEIEIQNILTHYKKLGKNTEKYVESFNSIASQYSDEQLKIIIRFLPLGVKAVLEAECPKYQQIVAFSTESGILKKQKPYNSTQINPKTGKERSTANAVIDNGIKIESINSSTTKKMTRPVVIPNTVSTKSVKKVKKIEENQNEQKEMLDVDVPEVKKGRGRPKKIQSTEENKNEVEQPKKKRGRPKKVQNVEKESQENQNEEPIFSFEIDENVSNTVEKKLDLEGVLPGIVENYKDDTLLEFDKINNENFLPGLEIKSENDGNINNVNENLISNYNNVEQNKLNNLLTSDKKIVAFVGTSKNGTSFLINNVAQIISNQGIKTAILDLTKNRNSYYIYTKNEEELRKKAIECTSKLLSGIADGVSINKNLDVYTSLPSENTGIDNYEKILTTLLQNYSLILLDCDFKTEFNYLKESQEVYLVQSMDVLTIQPLTAYLRELKAKNVLDQNKLRIVINKYIKVRSVTERTIIGGMSFYNDPSMSFMTELFNRENIRYTSIPFEMQTYSKYLEGLVNCNITTNGYSKEFMNALRKLSDMVYPLIKNTQNKYNNPKYNKYSKGY